MKLLVAKSGPLEGNRYAITGSTLLGRDAECDIQLIESDVSRKHCAVLEQDDGSVLVRDLVSHNGTHVRKERVTEALLQPGDELKVGDSCFEYRIVDDDTALTQELDLKLVSGPAADPTRTLTLSDDDRAEVIARAKALKAAPHAPPAEAQPSSCCGSPLSAHARAQRWKYCPACGKTLD
jgi:predicted component of type VI protein secretion system